MKILHLDDDPLYEQIVKSAFKKDEVIYFPTLKGAWDSFQDCHRVGSRYNAVVTDYNITGEDFIAEEKSGLELVRRIRTLDTAIPIIVTTSSPDMVLEWEIPYEKKKRTVRTEAASMNAKCLEKPFGIQSLRELLKSMQGE